MDEELTIKTGIMETVNHEYYVSLEVAKLLKEAGFDWKCINRYIKDTDMLVPCLGEANWNAAEWGINDYKSAPTLTVAQRWLREVKKIHIDASPENDEYTEWLVCVYDSNHTAYSGYKTYEEALEAGIKACLEQIITSAQQLC